MEILIGIWIRSVLSIIHLFLDIKSKPTTLKCLSAEGSFTMFKRTACGWTIRPAVSISSLLLVGRPIRTLNPLLSRTTANGPTSVSTISGSWGSGKCLGMYRFPTWVHGESVRILLQFHRTASVLEQCRDQFHEGFNLWAQAPCCALSRRLGNNKLGLLLFWRLGCFDYWISGPCIFFLLISLVCLLCSSI